MIDAKKSSDMSSRIASKSSRRMASANVETTSDNSSARPLRRHVAARRARWSAPSRSVSSKNTIAEIRPARSFRRSRTRRARNPIRHPIGFGRGRGGRRGSRPAPSRSDRTTLLGRGRLGPLPRTRAAGATRRRTPIVEHEVVRETAGVDRAADHDQAEDGVVEIGRPRRISPAELVQPRECGVEVVRRRNARSGGPKRGVEIPDARVHPLVLGFRAR